MQAISIDMALTRDFKVKDSLSVGVSGLFRAGETAYNPAKVAIDTYGKILSGGRDLDTIFNKTLPVLSNGAGVIGFAYDGTATKTIAISGAASLTNGQILSWSSSTGFVNSSLSETQLSGLSTAVAVNSANWSSVYTTYRSASGSLVNTITAPSVQGQVSVTNLSGGTTTVTLNNLGTGASPTFGTVSATQFVGGGAGLTGVTATPTFPGTSITDLATGNFIFVNDDSTFGAVSGNKRITYGNLLTDLAGTGLAVAADSDSIILKNSASLSNNTITYWDSGNGQLVNSIITQSGGVVSVGGALTANGNFGVTGTTVLDGILSVKGDITLGNAATDTLTINAGPVNFPNATAAADALVFGADANLYRSASGVLRTDNSLVVNTNLTVNGDITLGDSNTDTLTINAGPVNFPNATSAGDALILGTDVTLYRDGANVLRTNDSLVVDGNTTIVGNLSVLGDVTQINTLVTVTSALSVINFGSGPAIYVEQTGVQPIAQFVDKEGGVITFSDTGSVGIGTPAGAIPAEKLSVVGSISASGTLKLGSIAAGTSNSVVIESGGVLQDREINPGVWTTTAALISGTSTRTANTVPKFSDASGITNSTITDNGTDVTLGGNVIVTSPHKIQQYAEGAMTNSFSNTRIFTQGLLSGANTVTTFAKAEVESARYVVTLATGSLRTAFEILAVYNGTEGFGTVYALIDAQATSLLANVDVTVASTTIDLAITTTGTCSASIHGVAQRVL